jgi:hypothetical protein
MDENSNRSTPELGWLENLVERLAVAGAAFTAALILATAALLLHCGRGLAMLWRSRKFPGRNDRES